MAFLGLHILTSKQLAALKLASLSEADQVVAALKTTAIGAAVAADIAAVADRNLTGTEKFAAVVANTIPLVLKYATSGGIKAVEHDVADLARALVQGVYNDIASLSVGKIVGALLKLLGLK